MALAESEKNINLDTHLPEWIVSPTSYELQGIESSLHLVSEGCKKGERKKIFKNAYTKLMDLHRNATYQERLQLSRKVVAELQEQNPDINPNVFKSMKRSFAARTGYELIKLRKELKFAESTFTLPNGKEIQIKHAWSYVIDKVSDNSNNDKKLKRSVLIKIIDFRNKLKSIIRESNCLNPNELLQTCETGIAGLLRNRADLDCDTFLNENNITKILNPKRVFPNDYKYMTSSAAQRREETLESWVLGVAKNNRSTSLYN